MGRFLESKVVGGNSFAKFGGDMPESSFGTYSKVRVAEADSFVRFAVVIPGPEPHIFGIVSGTDNATGDKIKSAHPDKEREEDETR